MKTTNGSGLRIIDDTLYMQNNCQYSPFIILIAIKRLSFYYRQKERKSALLRMMGGEEATGQITPRQVRSVHLTQWGRALDP